jgi:hypothetical protein
LIQWECRTIGRWTTARQKLQKGCLLYA